MARPLSGTALARGQVDCSHVSVLFIVCSVGVRVLAAVSMGSAGSPCSMRIFIGRHLRTVGDYDSFSPEERAFLDDPERCLNGFGWPGRDHDRRPAWRARPPFPALVGLLCSASATDIIRCLLWVVDTFYSEIASRKREAKAQCILDTS